MLWKAIQDIESGDVKTIEEDPVDGLLPLNKKLTKKNVSFQSAKYNFLNDYKPISRPTIDSFIKICEYIDSKKDKENYLEKIKDLEKKNRVLIEQIKKSEKYAEQVARENYFLNEQIKMYKNK